MQHSALTQGVEEHHDIPARMKKILKWTSGQAQIAGVARVLLVQARRSMSGSMLPRPLALPSALTTHFPL